MSDNRNDERSRRRAKGTGSIRQRGEDKWLITVYVGVDADGKRRYVSEIVRGNKSAARDRLNELLTERARGQLTARSKDSLDYYLGTWLETVVKPSVRLRTYSDYEGTLRRYVRPYLGRKKLGRLMPADVRGMLVALRERGLGSRTIRQAHEVLRNALEQAVTDGLIRDNPARSRLVRKALPPKENRAPNTIPAHAVRDFLAVARDDRLAAYWLLLLFGGLRPEEALALRWSDISGNTVSIRRVLVDRTGLPLHFEAPKTQKSRRAVVLPDFVVQELREHRKRQITERLAAGPAWRDDPEYQDLVFRMPTGEWIRQDHTRDAFRKVLRAAGLPRMSPYALRHSCATLLLEQGIPLKVVSERLGHSTIALTADTYSHVTPSMQKQAADALESLAVGDD